MLRAEFEVKLPPNVEGLPQDEEYCLVTYQGKEHKIRFHDYDEIYKIPGLYEHLFYKTLKCQSHTVVSSFLRETVDQSPMSFSDLSIFELGAGNGLVGECLANYDAKTLVGMDIIEEAAEASTRDRPDVYDEYYVGDMCNLPDNTRRALEAQNFNCLVCVAALGFGDIPVQAFSESYNLIEDNGWIAFNIKHEFVNGSDSSGFSSLIQCMVEDSIMDVRVEHPYTHRLAIDGQPLEYVAYVGQKNADLPASYGLTR